MSSGYDTVRVVQHLFLERKPVYLALLTENRGPDIFGPRFVEAAGGGYARLATLMTNKGDIHGEWPKFSGPIFEDPDALITHMALFAELTDTQALAWCPVVSPRSTLDSGPLVLDVHLDAT